MSRYTILIAVRVTHRTAVTLVRLAAVAWILWLTHLAELAASGLYTCMPAYRQQRHHCLLESVLHVAQPSSSTGAAGSAMRPYPKDCDVYIILLFPLPDGLIQLYSAWTSTKLFSRILRKCIISPFSLTAMTLLPGSLKDTSVLLWQYRAQTKRRPAAAASPSTAVQTRRMPSWAAIRRVPLRESSPLPGTAGLGPAPVTHGGVCPPISSLTSSSSSPSSDRRGGLLSAICLQANDKLPTVSSLPNQAVVTAASLGRVRMCRADQEATAGREVSRVAPFSVLAFESKNTTRNPVREQKGGWLDSHPLLTSLCHSALCFWLKCPSALQ